MLLIDAQCGAYLLVFPGVPLNLLIIKKNGLTDMDINTYRLQLKEAIPFLWLSQAHGRTPPAEPFPQHTRRRCTNTERGKVLAHVELHVYVPHRNRTTRT